MKSPSVPNFKKILTPQSPEVAKKDRGALAATFKTSVDTLEIMRTWGVYTAESLAEAGQTLAKELLDITLEIQVVETPDVVEDDASASDRIVEDF